MNSLYTLALRQTSSLTAELAQLEGALRESSIDHASLNGQVVASLAGLERTVDDYEAMAHRELVEDKKGKALLRGHRIRADYAQLRKQYDTLKHVEQQAKTAADRQALLGPSSHSPSPAPRPRFTQPLSPNAESPFSSMHARKQTAAALDEHSFIADTHAHLDMYIAQGHAVLANLGSQRDMLKSTRTRLLTAANTLGLSRNTIAFIERRSRADFAIFLAGVACTFVAFYYIVRWFG